jgi:hypothetical protein
MSGPAVVDLKPILVHDTIVEAAIRRGNLEQVERVWQRAEVNTPDTLEGRGVSGLETPYH